MPVLPSRRGRARRIRTCDSQERQRNGSLRLIRVAQGKNRIAATTASTVSANRHNGDPLLSSTALPTTLSVRQLLSVSAHVQVDQCNDPKYEERDKPECRLRWYGIPLPGLPPMQHPESKHCQRDCDCPTCTQSLPPSAEDGRRFRDLEVSPLLRAQRVVDQANHVRDPETNKRREEECNRSLSRPLPKKSKHATHHANRQA